VYEEEWIPEHHKKKGSKGKEGGALSSGDEKNRGLTERKRARDASEFVGPAR